MCGASILHTCLHRLWWIGSEGRASSVRASVVARYWLRGAAENPAWQGPKTSHVGIGAVSILWSAVSRITRDDHFVCRVETCMVNSRVNAVKVLSGSSTHTCNLEAGLLTPGRRQRSVHIVIGSFPSFLLKHVMTHVLYDIRTLMCTLLTQGVF